MAGTAAALNGTVSWDPSNEANDMTSTDDVNYTLTVTGCTLENGTEYKFKVVKNHAWDEAFPASDKVFTVGETAVYTVEYTFNSDSKAVAVTTTKTGNAGEITHTYTVAGNSAVLFGAEWDATATANDMTANGDVYTWTKENVVLDGSAIEFKVCQDHAWGVAYPSSNFEVNGGHGYTGAGTYNVTISFNSNTTIITPVFTLQAAQDAEITSVAIRGAYASDTEWANAKTVPLIGSENVYTSPIAIDMSTTLEDFVFGLLVNGTFVNFEKVTIDEASSSLLVDDGSANHNILFKNSTSGYQTYTATATWTPGPDATAGWTLKVTGVAPRVLEYYLVGDLTGGWPEDDEDQTKDVLMTKQSNGLYTYEVASFAAEAQKYEYKLRANKIWGLYELPSSGNADYTFTEAGNYKLTFTANVTGEPIGDVAAYTLKLDAKKLTEPAVLPGTVIWEDATGVTPSWGEAFVTIASDKFASVKVGDKIHVAVQDVSAGGDWSAQVVLYDGYGTQLENGVPVGNGTVTDASFVVTGDMQKLLVANGMRVSGNNFTTTAVSIESPVYTGSENSVWVGDATLTWTHVEVTKYHFINANLQEGDIIKLTYESTGSPNIQLLPSDWSSSYGTVEYGDGSATLVVTAGNVAIFKEKGLIVNATDIRLTQIEKLDGNAINEVPLTITEGRHVLSSEFDQYPDDCQVRLSFANNTDPYASRSGWGIGQGSNVDNYGANENSIVLTGLGGKTFDIMITVGDLKKAAKNGGDSYVAGEYHSGGVTFNVYNGCSLTSVTVLVPVYHFITGDGSSWTVGDEMTLSEGSYTATVSGAGKYFAIARASSLNASGTSVVDWGSVVRPVTTDGDFVVNFANYSDNTEYKADGKVWVIGKTNDADVTIQFTPADGKFAISCQTEVEITDGYATYSNAQMYTVEGATANFVTVNSEFTEATLVPQKEGAILPASGVNTVATGKGIVLSGSGPAIIKSVDLAATAVNATGNMLTGTGDYTFNLNANDYTAYLLQTVNGQTGFQKWNGDTTTPLAAHKAFLAIPNVTAGAPAFISFGGGTTGIEAVTQSQRTGQYYTLDGRRVENPTKGLYIINGKKVVIK